MNHNQNMNTCKCVSNQGLFVPNRQLSAIVAGLLFLFFCVFMTGYFLGKKYTVELLAQKMNADFTDDKITALVLLENSTLSSATSITTVPLMPHEDSGQLSTITTSSQDSNNVVPVEKITKYYAPLIGFGTEKAAEQFVNKLSAKGIITEVKKRISKTVKGRTSYWYQVVTTAYSDKDDLEAVVARLVKEERLKKEDVRIQVC